MKLNARLGAIAVMAAMAAGTTSSGCAELAAVLPTLGFCGTETPTAELAKLGEGPALFVDAMRVVTTEVSQQARSLANGLQSGISVDQRAIEALGPYQWKGTGTYQREAAADRAFRLRFFYGDGVAGKAAGTPIEADLAKLESYLPDARALLDPSVPKGPLFPLVEAAGFSSGRLGLRDEALRFDVGSLVSTTLEGYGLRLNVGTTRNTVNGLLRQLGERKLALSLEDTAMENVGAGFRLAVKKFDLGVGLDGKADLGGDYLFEVTNGGLKYFGAVKTVGGNPSLSLRCGETEATEFATMTFVEGRADMKLRAENFPITLPGLAPLYAAAAK
jgi:hypothetical protein